MNEREEAIKRWYINYLKSLGYNDDEISELIDEIIAYY